MKRLLLIVSVVAVTINITAQTNYALSFNGTTQYVNIGAPLTGNASYTKEAWVYATTSGGARNIISSLNHPFWINGGILSAGQAGNYSYVTDPATFPLSRWVHVAVTYDAAATTMRLYRDGILISTNAAVPAYTSENNFIASHTGSGSYWQGKMDELRIWDVALTTEQLKAAMFKGPDNNASGLVAYYKCNDGSGTVLADATGGSDGTLQNAPAWVASEIQFAGNALSFDGTDDVVNIADNTTLDITTAITLEAWVYASKNTGVQNVVCKSSNAPNTGYIFPRTDNGWTNVVLYLHIGGSWRTLSAPYGLLNAWHHLAATYDGAMMRLYIDGVLAASQAQTGTIAVNSNVVALGNQTGIAEYFGGRADEIRIWNTARTQVEIQAAMNDELDPGTQTGLVSYYTFNQGITAGTNTGLTMAIDQKGSNNGELTNFALSGASSNFVTQNPDIIILPLTWLSFDAKEKDNIVLLNWNTAGEENTRDFMIQHSTSGVSWENLGVIAAAGNSTTIRDYSFTHTGPVNGINYYRIRQTDIDGRSSFSEIRLVLITKIELPLTVLTNPVDKGLLQVKLTRPLQLSLFNSEGRLHWKKPAKPGTITIDVSGYAKGIYLLKADGTTLKIIIQ
jgi:hypothetical protein